MTTKEQEDLAVRVSHMSKWFTDQSYEATTLREVVEALRRPAQCALWKPIDTKPKDHFPVLVDGPYGIFTAFQDVNWTWFARGADEPLKIEITHWMPLPARSALSSTDILGEK